MAAKKKKNNNEEKWSSNDCFWDGSTIYLVYNDKNEDGFSFEVLFAIDKSQTKQLFRFPNHKKSSESNHNSRRLHKTFPRFQSAQRWKKTNANKLWCTDTFNCSIYFQAGKTGAMTEEATEYECGWLRNQRNIKKPFASGKRKQCFFSLSPSFLPLSLFSCTVDKKDNESETNRWRSYWKKL